MHETHAALCKVTCLFVAAVGLSACQKPDNTPPALPTPPSLGEVWSEFDKFEAQLMERARKVIGDGDDFRIFATTLDYPIGTLLRMDKVIPIAECTPKIQPTGAAAPNLFPDYKLTKNLAVALGLDNAVISQLAEFGASLKGGDVFAYQVRDPVVRVLYDRQLTDLLAGKDCVDAIGGKPVRLVRGNISAQRDFVVSATTTGELKGKVAKIGSFEVSGGVGNSEISIKDVSAKSFLQIISLVVSVPASSSAAPTEVKVVAGAASAPPAGTGKVYVQQDKTDARDARVLVADIKRNFPVAESIERIDSAKMPQDPQVRYFNDADEGKAESIAAELKTKGYVTAQPVRLGLPAPAGQVEVWLPKNPSPAFPKNPRLEMMSK